MSSAYTGFAGCSPDKPIRRRLAINKAGYYSELKTTCDPKTDRSAFLYGQTMVFRSYGGGDSLSTVKKDIREMAKIARTRQEKMIIQGAKSALKEIEESY